MDFALTDEQRMFQEMFRDFAQNEVAPLAEALDRQERPPLETLTAAGQLDLLGIALPEEHGGINAGLLAYGLLMEELGKACLSTAVTVGAHCSAAMAIAASDADEPKQRFVQQMAKGQIIGAIALAEPDAGCDLSIIRTTASTDGAHVVLNGRKTGVLNGDIAGVIVVFARRNEKAAAVAVEKEAPGLLVGWRNKQMGLRAAAGSDVFLDHCRAPVANDLGEGYAILRRVSPFARLGLAFACLGIAERGLADSLEFAKNRQQFGGPIARKQAIQGYLGDMATQIETLRQLCHHVTWLMERDAAQEQDIAMLKLWAGQVATWVIDRAVQIHGGMGYIKSFHVERLYRDVRAMTILEGSSEWQRITVARELLEKAGVELAA